MTTLALCLLASCLTPRDDDRGTVVHLMPPIGVKVIPDGQAARWADLRVCEGYPYKDGRRTGAPIHLLPRLEFDRRDLAAEARERLPWPHCLPIRRGFLQGATLNCGTYVRFPEALAAAARDLRLGRPAIHKPGLWSVVFTGYWAPAETD